MKKVDIAYFAGIIDSDGCIYIEKYRNCRAYRLALVVVQRDMPLIERLYSLFGGSVDLNSRKRKDRVDFYLRWTATDTNAIKLLKQALPYLVLKKEQARLACELYKIKKRSKRVGRYRQYTDRSIAKQKEIYDLSKHLNSPATTERIGSLTKGMRQSELAEMVNRQRESRSTLSA